MGIINKGIFLVRLFKMWDMPFLLRNKTILGSKGGKISHFSKPFIKIGIKYGIIIKKETDYAT